MHSTEKDGNNNNTGKLPSNILDIVRSDQSLQ